MTIMQIIPAFVMGGAEIMCENLTYDLVKRGNDVIVVSLFNLRSAITERIEKSGVKILYLNKKRGFDAKIYFRLRRLLKKIRPDVVHVHLNAIHFVVPASIGLRIKKKIYTVHNVAEKDARKPFRIFIKIFFKMFNVTPVALSKLIQDTIITTYGLSQERIPIILNGIDLSKCQPKEHYNINTSFKVLHIGRFSEQKNHKCIIEAFRIFHAKSTDSELWLIGDGEKKIEIEQLVVDYGLMESVQFHGLQPNVYRFLHDADVFILPSLYEGIPMTLIEAMGTGLPIVATKVGGIPDMLTNEVSALLVDNDPDKVADALYRFKQDFNFRRTCGTNAKEKSHNFSSEKMAKRYEDVYYGYIE